MERSVPPPYTPLDKEGIPPSPSYSATPASNPGWNQNPFPQQQVINMLPVQQAPASVTAVTVNTGNGVPSAGSCPMCHSVSGFKTSGFTCCGYLWCLCCFPCGILCCLMCNRKKACKVCNFTTG
ncbi:hypothetical protein WA026_016414 [Henosepilachna vigintioctopunctata]|uniref:Membrane protein BRI3 n=1 Tax=Henosepilachna vigintioctopunctata TaxID=420089 RepID=A0AAW1UKB8_9CUCU